MSCVGFDNGDLSAYKELLLTSCGFRFDNEREKSLVSAVRQRMASAGLDSSAAYLKMLAGDRDEFSRLVELLTVNETYFFREQEHLLLVAERLSRELLAKTEGRPVRILCAGCSTGEEPYSVAILLRERFGADSARLFSITGVDIDATAIRAARNGVYGKGSFRGINPDLLRRWFERDDGDCFRVKDEVRADVTFEVVNLLSDAYPQAMLGADIIFYRNVSIYFPADVQRLIFDRLACLLREEGYLIVGAAETIHHDLGILTLMQRDGLFFYQKLPAPAIRDRRGAVRTHRQTDGTTPPPAGARPAAGKRGTGANPGHEAVRRPTNALRAAAPSPALTASASTGDGRAMFDEALELAAGGKTDAALSLLNALTGLDRSFVKAHTLKGSLLLAASRFEEAGGAAETALSLDPLCIEASLVLGIIARHADRDDEACKRFREAIFLDPACWLAHFHIAEIAFMRREKKRARSAYATALGILEKGPAGEHGKDFFPLTVKAEPFLAVCRHKLSILGNNG